METPRRARRRWRAGLLTPGRLAGDGIMGLSSPVANEVIATLRPRLVSAALRLQPWVRGMLTRRRLLRPASRLGQWALPEPAAMRRLQPHQLTGVRWLFGAWSSGGGILADDPGLGKTLQLLVLIDTLVRARLTRRVLVVVPANLLGNWEAEIYQWRRAGVLNFEAVVIQSGAVGLQPEDLLERLASVRAGEHLVCVISFEGLAYHGGELRVKRGVDLLVADEAHHLFNPGKMSGAFADTDAARRLLATGTPLANRFGEFFSLVDLACPGRLGTREDFKLDFVSPIEAGRTSPVPSRSPPFPFLLCPHALAHPTRARTRKMRSTSPHNLALCAMGSQGKPTWPLRASAPSASCSPACCARSCARSCSSAQTRSSRRA